ncbi:hypothetical protein F0344_07785 [Streptomyces finlayi]|uniref:Uncharacterized protein n=1 Tax=Streptomyces finlayi TaxID=67296 RepID=A0A7G7BGQ9_9ACTN|nr:hypothetical protein [Streptomyces finlayi]QNE74524.1 hypothetical protein F0344_07785 [Streptomyces finlayi]
MPLPELDLRLDDFEPTDPQVEEAFLHAVSLNQDMLLPLAEHHSPSGGNSFYVLHDSSVTWGIPGEPQIAALHLQRDLVARTFHFEYVPLPLPSMAQSLLINRGCPPDAIDLNPDLGPPPADEATRALERRLMGDGDHFACGYSYTNDSPDDMVTVAALRALDGRASSPFRVVIEEVDSEAWTHTLREGGFASAEEAVQWCQERISGTAGPLPPVRPGVSSTRPAALPKSPAPRPPGRSH